jgi:hypothetical protein
MVETDNKWLNVEFFYQIEQCESAVFSTRKWNNAVIFVFPSILFNYVAKKISSFCPIYIIALEFSRTTYITYASMIKLKSFISFWEPTSQTPSKKIKLYINHAKLLQQLTWAQNRLGVETTQSILCFLPKN